MPGRTSRWQENFREADVSHVQSRRYHWHSRWQLSECRHDSAAIRLQHPVWYPDCVELAIALQELWKEKNRLVVSKAQEFIGNSEICSEALLLAACGEEFKNIHD